MTKPFEVGEMVYDVDLQLCRVVELRALVEYTDGGRRNASLSQLTRELPSPAAPPSPVDLNARIVLGQAIAPGEPDTSLLPNGQQRGYVALSAEERAKGFVRPVRRSYKHFKCDSVTTMSRELAETYAREPTFYSGTYCVGCKSHFVVGEAGEFAWVDNPDQKVGT